MQCPGFVEDDDSPRPSLNHCMCGERAPQSHLLDEKLPSGSAKIRTARHVRAQLAFKRKTKVFVIIREVPAIEVTLPSAGRTLRARPLFGREFGQQEVYLSRSDYGNKKALEGFRRRVDELPGRTR